MPAQPQPQAPDEFDLGILTVIGIELRQVLKAFEIAEKRGVRRGSLYYWETTVYSQCLGRNLKVVIGCVAKAGMVHAAVRTSSFLQVYRPTMMLLVGIAAGWRPKLRIGQVVWPRHVIAVAQIEVLKKGYVFRPTQHEPTPAVKQMLQWWSVKEADLLAHTNRIMVGEIVPNKEAKDSHGTLVMYPPKAVECVIGCGDFLVRHDGHFTKLVKNDPQVRSCEMESAGMVIALEDAAPDTAWLQVRGISDFGDHEKDDAWQPYAAATASAFARLFAEQSFDPELILGKKEVDASVTAARQAPTETRAVATSIPVEVFEIGPVTAAISQDYENIRAGWKKGREAGTISRLQALRTQQSFQSAAPSIRAKVLRFEARVVLEVTRDFEMASSLANQASNLDGAHRPTAAVLKEIQSGPLAAAELLDNPITVEEWNYRMGYLLQAKEPDRVLLEFAKPPEGVGPDVESHRLAAYALVMKRRVPDARIEFEKIGPQHRDAFAVRLAAAVLDTYEAVSVAAPERAFHLQALPIPIGYIKRDEGSLNALERAAAAFNSLANETPEKNDFYYELQGWRLAAMSMNTRCRSEAEELCRQLLEERPTDVNFLGWADACEFRIQTEKHINALAAQLGVTL